MNTWLDNLSNFTVLFFYAVNDICKCCLSTFLGGVLCYNDSG